MKKKPTELNPYSDRGLDDEAFLRKLGIDPDEARSVADAAEIPFSDEDLDGDD